MLTDVVTLIAPDPQFMATSYLASTTPGTNPTITYLGQPDDDGIRQLAFIKGLAGYPWDILYVTQSWIRQRVTERVWGDPATGKVAYGIGVRRMPRYIVRGVGDTISKFQWTMQPPETDYIIYDPNGVVSHNSDGGVRCTFHGPYPGAAMGDLPAGEDWYADYEWAGKSGVYGVMERLTHRKGYGRYQWQSFPSDGKGGYLAPNAQSLQTMIKTLPAGGVVPVQRIF